ncbi:MAG: PQQ-like beta-propeller repeat protein, partial [Planctomycetales bacterium]|nr:PQQ-like beta-propeller repeat protein [Planctomycetales bacterium]
MIGSQNSISLIRIVTINAMSLAVLLGCLASLGCSPEVAADDWPMWRSDAGHTAAVDGSLPEKLVPSWVRTYSARIQVWDDPLNHDLMQYDRIFEPVVKDGRMFVNFNDADKIVALDTKTGKELWTFYTDGPVRFPAVAWEDCVLFVSDDGFLYAVNAADGSLKWKFQGAPSSQKAIGNLRMISAWPARGGPVVEDGTVYFSASIWPFMGTFLYALDADSGEVQWVNDSTSAQYIKQPHSAPSFAGVAPQGTMTIVGDRLIVPGGRSIPASFDRHTG